MLAGDGASASGACCAQCSAVCSDESTPQVPAGAVARQGSASGRCPQPQGASPTLALNTLFQQKKTRGTREKQPNRPKVSCNIDSWLVAELGLTSFCALCISCHGLFADLVSIFAFCSHVSR